MVSLRQQGRVLSAGRLAGRPRVVRHTLLPHCHALLEQVHQLFLLIFSNLLSIFS